MARSRAHTSVQAADTAKLLLLNKHWVKHTECRGVLIGPNIHRAQCHGVSCVIHLILTLTLTVM